MEPDLDAFLYQLCSGGGYNFGFLTLPLGAASGALCNATNPPYTANDFLAFSPKSGGTPVSLAGTFTTGSPAFALGNGVSAAGVAVGQLVASASVPNGTTISAIDLVNNILTLSANATASGAGSLSVYNAPLIPLVALNLYITLANASIMQARWQSAWLLAMHLYVAHYVTLWMQAEGTTATTAGQAAASGLASGIKVAKSVGSVSVSLDRTPGLDDFGTWNLTTYGQQLATMAKVVGMGPIYIR